VLRSGEQDCVLGAAAQLPPQGGRAHQQRPPRTETDDGEGVNTSAPNAVEASQRDRGDGVPRFRDHVYLRNGEGAFGASTALGRYSFSTCAVRTSTTIAGRVRGVPNAAATARTSGFCRSGRRAISTETAANNTHVKATAVGPSFPARGVATTAAAAIVSGTVATIRLR
jgi:hypothetical protein